MHQRHDREFAVRLERASLQANRAYARTQQLLSGSGPVPTLSLAGGAAVVHPVVRGASKAIAVGLEGPVEEGQLDDLEAFFREHEAVPRALVCPWTDTSLTDALGRRSYRIAQWMNLLVRELSPGGGWDEPDPASPAGLEIEVVDPEETRSWAELLAAAFTHPEPPGEEHIQLQEIWARTQQVTCYLARRHGLAVAAGSLMVVDGIASIHVAGTLPSARGRGVHRALIRRRMADALAAGCDIALLGVEPGSSSQRNGERLGFRTAYTRLLLEPAGTG